MTVTGPKKKPLWKSRATCATGARRDQSSRSSPVSFPLEFAIKTLQRSVGSHDPRRPQACQLVSVPSQRSCRIQKHRPRHILVSSSSSFCSLGLCWSRARVSNALGVLLRASPTNGVHSLCIDEAHHALQRAWLRTPVRSLRCRFLLAQDEEHAAESCPKIPWTRFAAARWERIKCCFVIYGLPSSLRSRSAPSLWRAREAMQAGLSTIR